MINENFDGLRCVSLLCLVVMPNTPKVMMPRVLQVDSKWWFLEFILFLSSFSHLSYFPLSSCINLVSEQTLIPMLLLNSNIQQTFHQQPNTWQATLIKPPAKYPPRPSIKTHHHCASQVPTKKKKNIRTNKRNVAPHHTPKTHIAPNWNSMSQTRPAKTHLDSNRACTTIGWSRNTAIRGFASPQHWSRATFALPARFCKASHYIVPPPFLDFQTPLAFTGIVSCHHHFAGSSQLVTTPPNHRLGL